VEAELPLDGLQALEGRERVWGRIEKPLRRSFPHLPPSARAPGPDRQLDPLRLAIRDGTDAEGSARSLSRLAHRRAAAHPGPSSPYGRTVRLLAGSVVGRPPPVPDLAARYSDEEFVILMPRTG
jgi:hypothetical protein